MKIKYIFFIDNQKANIRELQNNQKKDILKICKRMMFTKGSNSIVLKKSGEVIIPSFKNDVPFVSPSTRLNSLILPTINTVYKNKFAQYNQIDINHYKVIEPRDCIAEFSSIERYTYLKEVIFNSEKSGDITKEQSIVFLKRLNCLYRSFVHTSVIEKIKEENGYVTYQYYVITTKSKEVDLGGPNIFKPLFLYTDVESKKSFYAIPLVYINKVTIEEYLNVCKLKKTSDFKDSIELQKILTEKIRKLSLENEIYQFDIKKDCLELNPKELNPSEKFLLKNSNYILTEFEQIIFN